jgi:hypothetical protein
MEVSINGEVAYMGRMVYTGKSEKKVDDLGYLHFGNILN